MEAKTFREQVGEIQQCPTTLSKHDLSLCLTYQFCWQCQEKRILAAHNAELERIAEGMIEMANNPYDGETKYYTDIEESPTDIAGSAFSEGQVAQLEKRQDYIQAQKEGM